MQKEGLQGGSRAAGEGEERLKKREKSGSRRRTREAREAGGEVRHTHFVYKRNARAGKQREEQREASLWAIGSAEKLGYLIPCHEAPTVGAVRDGRIGAVLTSRFLLKSRFSMRYYERLMVSLWVGLQQQ